VTRSISGTGIRSRLRSQWAAGAAAAGSHHAKYLEAVFFSDIGDVGFAGFEDPQAEQPEHDQREVEPVTGIACRG
jgi:hypothetical protein